MNLRSSTSRNWLILSAIAVPMVLLDLLSGQANAQAPAQVKIIVGFAPGGGTDLIARILAEKMRESLAGGTQIVVENKAGAGGKIAVDALRASSSDGGAILLAPLVTPVMSQLTFKNPGFDPAKDMTPIGMVGHSQFALAVTAQHPAKTMPEFVNWLKANPKKANFGTASAGSLPHFFGVMLGNAIGVGMEHVAYKGGTPMLNDLMGGQIPCGIDTDIVLIELHKSGKIRILASFAESRSSLIPEVPTMAELGYKNATASGWYSMWAPAKTPAATVLALNKALNFALSNADVSQKLARIGVDPAMSTPEGLEKLRAAEIEKWRPVIAASGFKAE